MLRLLAVCFATVLAWLPAEEAQKGFERGIVKEVDRDKNCLTITTEGGYSRVYRPRWLGGMPNTGGGPDKNAIEQIRACEIGEKIGVYWTKDECYRVVDIQRPGAKKELREPGHMGERGGVKEGDRFNNPNGTDNEAHPLSACLEAEPPAETSGKAEGTISQVDPKGRVVITDTAGCERVFIPPWKNGGFDPAVVAKISALRPGQKVRIDWQWDQRERLTNVTTF